MGIFRGTEMIREYTCPVCDARFKIGIWHPRQDRLEYQTHLLEHIAKGTGRIPPF